MSTGRKRETQQFTLTEIINFQKDYQKLITNKEIQRTYKIFQAILLPIENEQILNNIGYLQLKKYQPYTNQITRIYDKIKNPQIVENHIKKLNEVTTIILKNLESVIQTIENKTKKTTQTNEIIESLTSLTPIEERITLFKNYNKKNSTTTKGFSIILTNMQHLEEILKQKQETTYLKNWVTILNTFYNRNNAIIETTEKTLKIIEEEHTTLSNVLEVILENNVYKDEGLIKTIIIEPIEQMRNLKKRGVKFEKTRKYNKLNINHLLRFQR